MDGVPDLLDHNSFFIREEILVITRQQISANVAANEEEHLRLGYDTKKHY